MAVFFFHTAVIAGIDKRLLPPIEAFGRTFSRIPSPFSLGASGVNLFFVLSGFCLALQPLRQQLSFGGAALRRYFLNRVARIVPVYWLVVLASAGLALIENRATALPIPLDVGIHALFLHGFDTRTLLSLHGGLWSMATEVQFYVVFPLLMTAYRGAKRWPFVAAALVATLAFRVGITLVQFPDAAGSVTWEVLLAYALPGRALEFCLGIFLADCFIHDRAKTLRVSRWLLFPLVLFALWARAAGPKYLPDIAMGLAYAAITALVVFSRFGEQQSPGWLLRNAAAFGRASYSFFLVHYLVLLALGPFVGARAELWSRMILLNVVGLPLSVVLSVALYLGIELPLWQRFRAR